MFFYPAYERRILDFTMANLHVIRRAMDTIKWQEAFSNLNASDRVYYEHFPKFCA